MRNIFKKVDETALQSIKTSKKVQYFVFEILQTIFDLY